MNLGAVTSLLTLLIMVESTRDNIYQSGQQVDVECILRHNSFERHTNEVILKDVLYGILEIVTTTRREVETQRTWFILSTIGQGLGMLILVLWIYKG